MKVSVNWLKEYTDIDLSVDQLVKKIGVQLGAVDEVIDLGEKYHDIVAAKVVSCEKHPNADKLHVCKIDDGGKVQDITRDENGHVQVVCGAPNVREDLTVAWLPPGTTIPATFDKDPFALEAREIRGQISNGMLASPSELAISDDHSGILEIPDGKAKPGDDFAKTFGLDDYIIDIENKMFTHRPDLFGILGIAREIAGIQHKLFKSPNWYTPAPEFPVIESEELKLEVRNEIPEFVPRFTAITMSGVQLGPSPLWLQILLAKIGIKSINNIVDYSNYFMYLTSQPIHIYDYDKVKALSSGDHAVMIIRHAKPEETITTLSGKTIAPSGQTMMVATDQKLICVGGAIGGAETEVDDSTKNIIIEAANWDMFQMRRTSMEYGIFTDAVTRFTKDQSPMQNLAVVAKIVDEIRKEANGKVASKVIDAVNCDRVVLSSFHYREVVATVDFINSRLGLSLSSDEIEKLLKNVEFGIEKEEDKLAVCIPFWRTDIEIPEDVVEEVGRLYGYDHLPLDLPKRSIVPVEPDNLLTFKQQLRFELAKLGANEVLTYSFVHGNLLDKADLAREQAFKITNALSPDLQYYRLSLTPSLLDKIHMNIKAGYDEFALFEIGKTHHKEARVKSEDPKEDGLPMEFERLSLVYAANDKVNRAGAPYYQAKRYLEQLISIEMISFDEKLLNSIPPLQQMTAPYDPARSALLWNGKMPVGVVGEFKSDVSRKLKLPAYSAGFEVFISALQKFPARMPYKPLSRFPSISQDICLQVPENVAYGELSRAFDEVLKSNLDEQETVLWQPIDIYTSDELTGQKRITYRVTLVSHVRTLTDAALTAALDKVAAELQKSHAAKRI